VTNMNTSIENRGKEGNSWQIKGDSAASWQPPGVSFTPGQATAPSSKVELSMCCSKLADMDTFSKSDPFLVLYQEEREKSGKWIELGRTETIDNTLNPEWQTKFVLEFTFEKRQLLRFEVYDSDSDSRQLADHDFIGRMECSLGEVVSSGGKGLTRVLVGEKAGQTITVSAEELLACREWIHLSLAGRKLDRKDWWGFGSSDPFVTFLKSGEFSQWTVVHRTEVKKGKLNPQWLPLSLSLSSLCNGDHHRPLRLRVEDWNMNGSHSLIGEIETCVDELLGASAGDTFPLVNPKKKQKKRKYKNSGNLVVQLSRLETRPTFLDFIQHGTELSFIVAIDFTASNGNPADSKSLHYIDPTGAPNQYGTAIKSVGDIIQDYDTDKMFPALGFGARLPPDGRVSHRFSLNLENENPCLGVEGILNAYHRTLSAIQLYGPTNFSPVINHVASLAGKEIYDASNYYILLIITDGVITDLEATKKAVVQASHLPMSIIIIGVGSEDFTAMDDLDSDDSLLTDGNGRVASRDIVQFVELQKFVEGQGARARWNKELLAREVLAELPEQIVGYMQAKGFKPGQGSVHAGAGHGQRVAHGGATYGQSATQGSATYDQRGAHGTATYDQSAAQGSSLRSEYFQAPTAPPPYSPM